MRSSAYTLPTIFFLSLLFVMLSTACKSASYGAQLSQPPSGGTLANIPPTVNQLAQQPTVTETLPPETFTPRSTLPTATAVAPAVDPTVAPEPTSTDLVPGEEATPPALLQGPSATLPRFDPGEVTPRPPATETQPPTPTAEPTYTPTRFPGVRIQTVGDSITEGGMYRLPLITLLNSTGCRYDMVGSRETGWAKGWDGDHQGYGGATAYWLVDDGIGLGQEMSSAFAIYRPDIVLLHIGTNDLWNTERDPTTIAEFVRTLIFKIRAGRADTDIYLAQIIPGQPFDVTEYNRQLQRIAQETTTAASPVILVDMTTNFDPNSDTSDGVHPNPNGGEKMALNWFNAMQIHGWCESGG